LGERSTRSGPKARKGYLPPGPPGEPPAHWLNDVIDHLPVAVGLVGKRGTYVARSGKLGALLGDVIASRSGRLRDRWQVVDMRGRPVSTDDWPSEKSLRDDPAIHTANATFTTAEGEHKLLITATPFKAPDGEARSIVMMQNLDLQRPFDDGYTQALMDIIQTIGERGEGFSVEQARAMLDRKLRLPPPKEIVAARTVTTAAEDGLSEREAEVLRLIAWGHSQKVIGAMLNLAPRTVEFHRGEATKKLRIKTRADIVRYCVGKGWLSRLD
jgi:DNA-binding CsgD family transcriptional regulator